MTPEDEAAIIARFTLALQGRFGPLKPAQAIARCVDYITELRGEHLAWAEIHRLFNDALKAENCKQLSPGSVSRLYLLAIRRPRAPAPSPVPAISAPRSSAPMPPTADSASLAPNPTTPSTPLSRHGSSPASHQPAKDYGSAAGNTNSHLERIKERREAKKRMDEA